jgi:2-oxoglutarate ferredoxin oxidoreductase subunit alpha
VVIRFAGDSGDGMQLTGGRFTSEAVAFGNDLATLPDFPAEIRAPLGTAPGVSSFQVQFADYDILNAGDRPDVLVAMNPATLKSQLPDLRQGHQVNADGFGGPTLRSGGAGPRAEAGLETVLRHDPARQDSAYAYALARLGFEGQSLTSLGIFRQISSPLTTT